MLLGICLNNAHVYFGEINFNKMYSFILSFAYQFVKATSQFSLLNQAMHVLAVAGILFGSFMVFSRTRKRRGKQSLRLLRHYFTKRIVQKREKSKGGVIFLLLLMLIACVAILWVLWALGGIFALILGIVLGVGILSLILKDQ